MSTNHAPFARRDERVWAPQAGAQTPDRSGPSSSPKRRSRRRVPTRLHLESLEDRSLPTATSLATLVSPLWFQDLSGAEDPLHAGPAAWSAASADEQAPALAGDDQTCDWIVRFDAAAATAISSLADTASLLVGSGVEFEVLRGLGLVGQVLVRSYGAPAAAVEDSLSNNQNVSAFERDGLRQLLAMPNDPMAGQLWGLVRGDDGFSFQVMQPKIEAYRQFLLADPAVADVTGTSGGRGGISNSFFRVRLKPLSERRIPASDVIARLRAGAPTVSSSTFTLHGPIR